MIFFYKDITLNRMELTQCGSKLVTLGSFIQFNLKNDTKKCIKLGFEPISRLPLIHLGNKLIFLFLFVSHCIQLSLEESIINIGLLEQWESIVEIGDLLHTEIFASVMTAV